MNKRLFVIYTTVFLLIGVMLHLYRTSYNAMKQYIEDGRKINNALLKFERLNGLLHFWFHNTAKQDTSLDLYIPSDVAYDSILANVETLKGMVLYQEERLRLDSIKWIVKDYQSHFEKGDTAFLTTRREYYQRKLMAFIAQSFQFSRTRLADGKSALDDATALLDRWLVWMLVLAGGLITLATFYSFSFLNQRRRAESFSQILLETTTYGIISFKPDYIRGKGTEYRVTYCNEAAMKILHLRNWRKKALTDILPKSILKDVIKSFRQVMFTKNSKTIEGYLEFGSDRTWLNANIAPLDEGVLVSIYDLNPMKAYEQRLTYQIKQLELANDELQQYAYVTSHDLQEPLRKIQMFGDLALNAKSDHQKNKDDYLHKIVNSASHMRDLIQTLLEFTRSTDQPSVFEEIDLNEIVKKVTTDLDVLIAEKKAKITCRDLPVIKASEVHMNLLFTNLITNSLKYSHAEVTPRIEIVAGPVAIQEFQKFPALDQMVRYTKISVHDNGVGFNPSYNDKIFTIFQRLHNKENTAGAGIGLAICRKIVHQHHGFIYADGRENEGASFHIFLPFEQPS